MSGMQQNDPYGQSPDGQDPRGRNPYGQGPSDAGPRWPDAAAQAPYGQPPQGLPSYGAGQGDGTAPQYAQSPQYGQGPQYAQAPQYAQGTQQAAPGAAGWPAPAGAARRPGSITAAFWLILSAGLVFLLSTVLAAVVAGSEQGRAQLESMMEQTYRDSGLPADQVDQIMAMVPQMLPVVTGGLVVVGVLAFLVYLLIALKVRQGSRAARTVGTVLAVLSAAMVLLPLLTGSFSPLDLVWCLLGIAGIVMAYRKDATEFMRLRAWERAARRG